MQQNSAESQSLQNILSPFSLPEFDSKRIKASEAEEQCSIFESPLIFTHHKLFVQYSSSQHYFYSTKISQIIKQKCTTNNILFQDIQCLLDQEQYMKRQYKYTEYHRKLSTFKQYYFYHEDCPRIYGQLGVAEAYQKWHEKKRDHIYKKLKLLYNETYTSANSSDNSRDQMGHGLQNVTHFLNDISEYNPYSKKYYLRVQARQQKQREKEKQLQKERELQKLKKRENETQQKNNSFELYHNYNKQLSRMINRIKDNLSVLQFSQIQNSISKKDRNESKPIIKSKIGSESYSLQIDLKLGKNLSKIANNGYKSIDNVRKKNAIHRISSNLQENFKIDTQRKTPHDQYVYIEQTEGSQNKKQGKATHKKYSSQFHNHKIYNPKLHNDQDYREKEKLFNFGSTGLASTDLLQMKTNKKSLIMNLGKNYQKPYDKSQKNIAKFSQKQIPSNNSPVTYLKKNPSWNRKQELIKIGVDSGDKKQKIIKLEKIKVPRIESNHKQDHQNEIKSYKSLSRFNTFNNNFHSQPKSNELLAKDQKTKYSSSTSKINLGQKAKERQREQKQKYNINLLSNLLDKKLTQKHNFIQQFADKKLISYKSQNVPSPNLNVKYNESKIKNDNKYEIKFIGKSKHEELGHQQLNSMNRYNSERKTQKREFKEGLVIRSERKIEKNSPQQKILTNIRINHKSSHPHTQSMAKNLFFKK